jgi:hypothetical protein
MIVYISSFGILISAAWVGYLFVALCGVQFLAVFRRLVSNQFTSGVMPQLLVGQWIPQK